MKIDCTNSQCPKPVIDTKNALEQIKEDEILEVLVNSDSSKENVVRFAKNAGYNINIQEDNNFTKIFITKNFTCKKENIQQNSDFIDTTIFLKDDKIGEGKLGKKLIVGFMRSVLEQKKLPKKIICVNRAVFLTTADDDIEIIKIFKELEKKGVEIFSCGVCLNYFAIEDKLKVGKIGNAYETIEILLKGSVSL